MTLFVDYKFQITEEGLLMTDHDEDTSYMITLDRTPFSVGDSFVLELDERDRLFFRRVDIRDVIEDEDYIAPI